MRYAKVVLGLPVEGPFDYIIPAYFDKKIKVGMRVWVPFRTQKMLGYVIKIIQETKIKNLKTILEIIDGSPILDKNMLSLTRALAEYYCCSWGEAIDTALPEGIRKGKVIPKMEEAKYSKKKDNPDALLIHDLDGRKRWEIYLQEIKGALADSKSVIILFPDKDSVIKAKELIQDKTDASLAILYRKKTQELEEWVRIKEGKANIIIGTRSAIFAPVKNLGLVIIDEEQDSAYKQDQVPHYLTRGVAFMRIRIEKAKLILASTAPSLESIYLARNHKIRYLFNPRARDYPEIKITAIDYLGQGPKQKKEILSKYLQDSIILTFNSHGKALLFLNRSGFATFASCLNCGVVLKCPRCNINLVYHFKDNLLNCHYCNFKMSPPKICPNCKSGYIKYSGTGSEKIESELFRLFPQARIKRLDNQKEADLKDADIFVSGKSIIKGTDFNFDLVEILSIDNSLNRLDFRSSEKTFALLVGLLGLTEKKMIIQTNLAYHYCFQALINKDMNMFYDEELKQRRLLAFPPYRHIGLVKLRGKKEARVQELSDSLFKRLKKYKTKGINIFSVNPAQPAKLRGNFYWQIFIKSNGAKGLVKFLKKHLKDFKHSGIIVTVDIDPL